MFAGYWLPNWELGLVIGVVFTNRSLFEAGPPVAPVGSWLPNMGFL